MVDGRNPKERTFKYFRKIVALHGDDCTTGCLLDYSYFKEYYKLITVDRRKQQPLNGDQKVIQQINFTWNLEQAGNTTMSFILEEVKKTVSDFSQGRVRLSSIYFHLI